MKKALLLFIITLCSFAIIAEEAETESPKKERTSPNVVVSPNFVATLIGYYGADLHFNTGDNIAIESQFGYWNIRNIFLVNELLQPEHQAYGGYLKMGPTYYFMDTFHGPFIGAYAKGMYFSYQDTMNSMISAGAFGAGAKGGWRGTWGWFSLALLVSYEYTKPFAEITTDGITDAYIGNIQGGAPMFSIEMGFAIYD